MRLTAHRGSFTGNSGTWGKQNPLTGVPILVVGSDGRKGHLVHVNPALCQLGNAVRQVIRQRGLFHQLRDGPIWLREALLDRLVMPRQIVCPKVAAPKVREQSEL